MEHKETLFAEKVEVDGVDIPQPENPSKKGTASKDALEQTKPEVKKEEFVSKPSIEKKDALPEEEMHPKEALKTAEVKEESATIEVAKEVFKEKKEIEQKTIVPNVVINNTTAQVPSGENLEVVDALKSKISMLTEIIDSMRAEVKQMKEEQKSAEQLASKEETPEVEESDSLTENLREIVGEKYGEAIARNLNQKQLLGLLKDYDGSTKPAKKCPLKSEMSVIVGEHQIRLTDPYGKPIVKGSSIQLSKEDIGKLTKVVDSGGFYGLTKV